MAPVQPKVKPRSRSVKLSKQMRDAIEAFGADPSPANRTVLERRIREYARRRKYDGEVLTLRRAHSNSRGRK